MRFQNGMGLMRAEHNRNEEEKGSDTHTHTHTGPCLYVNTGVCMPHALTTHRDTPNSKDAPTHTLRSDFKDPVGPAEIVSAAGEPCDGCGDGFEEGGKGSEQALGEGVATLQAGVRRR